MNAIDNYHKPLLNPRRRRVLRWRVYYWDYHKRDHREFRTKAEAQRWLREMKSIDYEGQLERIPNR